MNELFTAACAANTPELTGWPLAIVIVGCSFAAAWFLRDFL